ncbi:TetR/AcrR family transcriptional regulator [Aldersonia kunmingensis]|uniref:TetR/AcrR family transcriptional regulator n=1 Tax=Aldersonia kunmingensis TaxID=408066 RepID=UPI00082C92F5|nr:TetR/AcrR family transcriptional regulator [Aldersonia kunmingensis]
MTNATETKRMDGYRRREQIIACAMQLFERGYSEVSIGDVAEAAGVGRPLIHHYFGTKRELYLEAVRRLTYIPAVVVTGIKGATLDERIDASIDRWLTVAWRHRNMWVSTIAIDAGGSAGDVDKIMREADTVAVERMLGALGIEGDGPKVAKLRIHMLTYGALAKYASRLWLKEQSITRDEAQRLLTATLRTIIVDVVGIEE